MRNAKSNWFLFLLTGFLVACNSDIAANKTALFAPSPAEARGNDGFAALRAASCPDPSAFITPQSIDLTVTPIIPDSLDGTAVNGLTFAGAWHLTSDDPNFGGLSGLAVHPKDHLLAISDNGAFIWISMLGNAPSGFAAKSFMRGANGDPIDGKNDADAEGLALIDGLALVSFERNHRVAAFDLGNCGAAARAASVTQIPSLPDGLGRAIPGNQGAEALVLSADNKLLAGLELKSKQGAPIVQIGPEESQLQQYLPRPSGKRLVGLDDFGGTLFALFRSYSPLTGNENIIHAHYPGAPEPVEIAALKRPFPVDNFEGITAARLPDGTVRLYIISDDNFSDRQRTLLMAFDVVPASSGD